MEDIKMAIQGNAKPNETTMGPQPAGLEPASSAAVAEPAGPVDPVIDHEEVARLAYSYWEARSFCGGSPEEDWFRAEEDLRRGAATAARTAGA
jgi:hypothetical protein